MAESRLWWRVAAAASAGPDQNVHPGEWMWSWDDWKSGRDFTDIDNYGDIFDVRDNVTQIVCSLKIRLEGIEVRVVNKPKALVFEFYNGGEQLSDIIAGIAKDALDKSGSVSIFLTRMV